MRREYKVTKSKYNEECIMYKRTIKNEPNNIKKKWLNNKKTQEFYRQQNHDDKKYKIKVNRNKKLIFLAICRKYLITFFLLVFVLYAQ